MDRCVGIKENIKQIPPSSKYVNLCLNNVSTHLLSVAIVFPLIQELGKLKSNNTINSCAQPISYDRNIELAKWLLYATAWVYGSFKPILCKNLFYVRTITYSSINRLTCNGATAVIFRLLCFWLYYVATPPNLINLPLKIAK